MKKLEELLHSVIHKNEIANVVSVRLVQQLRERRSTTHV